MSNYAPLTRDGLAEISQRNAAHEYCGDQFAAETTQAGQEKEGPALKKPEDGEEKGLWGWTYRDFGNASAFKAILAGSIVDEEPEQENARIILLRGRNLPTEKKSLGFYEVGGGRPGK